MTTLLLPEQIRTASLYPLATLEARTKGTRPMVVTRYWPRGVKRVGQFYLLTYMPKMAPSAELLASYKTGDLSWDAFAVRYCQEIQPSIAIWRAGMRDYLQAMRGLGGDETAYTLLCHEHDAPEDTVRCHRRLLRDMLLETTGGDA